MSTVTFLKMVIVHLYKFFLPSLKRLILFALMREPFHAASISALSIQFLLKKFIDDCFVIHQLKKEFLIFFLELCKACFVLCRQDILCNKDIMRYHNKHTDRPDSHDSTKETDNIDLGLSIKCYVKQTHFISPTICLYPACDG